MVANAMATNAGTQGEESWFDYMASAFPGVGLGEHHELFDAAMTVVCPDLGYERGYDYTTHSDADDDPSEPLPDAPPGTPGWHFINCAGALDVLTCSAEEAALYARWGERLPYLYFDPEGSYGVGPYLGDYLNESISYDQFNRTALALCQQMDAATDVNAMSDWFDAQTSQFPTMAPASHMLMFHAAMTLVCPEVVLPTNE